SAFDSPLRYLAGNTADQLADAGFAIWSSESSMKVFGGNNIGGGHRPGSRDFNVLLLEDHLPALPRDGSGPVLPLHRVVRRNAFAGEIPPEFQPLQLCNRNVVVRRCRHALQNVLFHEPGSPYIEIATSAKLARRLVDVNYILCCRHYMPLDVPISGL